MAANETFCLRFNEFEGVIKSCWQELQKDNDLCDMTLACEDRQIKTHKFVISAFSPILRSILKLHQKPHPLIYLRKVKYINLLNLIRFMYQGELDVSEEDLPSFLEAAEDLNIRGLSEANTEGCNSSREFLSEPSYQDIAPASKRKRVAERQEMVKVKSYNPSDESELGDSYDPPTEVVTQNYDESSSQKVVSTLSDKQFPCRKCDKSFSGQSGLFLHNKSIHEGVKYPCTKCSYKGTTKYNLQQHVAGVHEGVKYPCTKCSFKGTTKSNLQQHVAGVHEGVKYTCAECNYEATQKGNLKQHVAAKHT